MEDLGQLILGKAFQIKVISFEFGKKSEKTRKLNENLPFAIADEDEEIAESQARKNCYMWVVLRGEHPVRTYNFKWTRSSRGEWINI